MRVFLILLAFGSVCGELVVAQSTPAATEGWYTQAQATRGAALFDRACASCHGADLSGGNFAPALAGDTFAGRWRGQTVGDLFTIVKGTMPADEPKSLLDEEYADVVAYLLSKNGYLAGEKALTTSVPGLMQLFFKKS